VIRAVRLPALALALAFTLQPSGGQSEPNLAQALSQQRVLAQQRPGDAGVWNDLGNLLALQGELADAELAYRRALELDPASASARFNLALLREQAGDFEGAAADYAALIEVAPDHAWAHYRLGTIDERRGRREEALRSFAEAFTLDPELLFAETNPHIIENRLVTEALLLARRGSRSGPPAPRAYDEPHRIQSLLAPSPLPSELGAPAQAPADEPIAAPVDQGPPAGPAPVQPWGTPHPPPATRPAAGRIDSEPATSGPESGAPGDRVLDPTDLRGGARNQVQGGEGAPAAPGARGRRAGATVQPPGGRRTLHQPPDDRDWSGFGAGQRSTGALEWHLAPPSDAPVPAR
jgi:predicted Zn-dependent protease